jgi:hypothetical protein
MQESGGVVEVPSHTSANSVESMIEFFAERWNKIASQAEADRLQAEMEHAAMSVSAEELLAYAASPPLRGRLLSLCVFARAQERAATPRGGGAVVEVRVERLDGPGLVSSRVKSGA